MEALLVALALVIALLSILVIGLLRSHAEILRRLESLGAGMEEGHHSHSTELTLSLATGREIADRTITGVTPEGEPVVISLASGGDPTLLAFLSTTCSSCTTFWEGLSSSLMHFGGRRHRVLIVTLGEAEESPTRAASHAGESADVVMSSQAWSEFGVPGAPYFVLVDSPSTEIIGEGSAMTYRALEEFLRDSTNDRIWDRRSRPEGDDEESRIDADLRQAGSTPICARPD